MHRFNPKGGSLKTNLKEGKNLVKTHEKEANRSRVERDRDLKGKAAEKRCRSQPRGRGKGAVKKEEISKKKKGQEGGPKGGPNKTTRGDLKGRRVDLKGPEKEVSDLRKKEG